MKIIEIAFTGYPVTDMPRARAFYEKILGLKQSRDFVEEGGKSWVEYDLGANTFAITDFTSEWKPSTDGPCIAFEVDDFDDAVASLRKASVQFLKEPITTPGCRIAIITDPDGNCITIHKRNP